MNSCGIMQDTSYFVHSSAVIDAGASIGAGSKVWHFTHIMSSSAIGENCIIGQNVFIDRKVKIGNGVKIQNNVSVYQGVTLEDDVGIQRQGRGLLPRIRREIPALRRSGYPCFTFARPERVTRSLSAYFIVFPVPSFPLYLHT